MCLGTGVCIPTDRIPPVTANMLASPNQIAPSHIDWVVGTGFSALCAMGLLAINDSTFEKQLRAVMDLVAHEASEREFIGQRHKIRFVNPDMLVFNIADPIRCLVAAIGPCTLARTAELGGHWM